MHCWNTVIYSWHMEQFTYSLRFIEIVEIEFTLNINIGFINIEKYTSQKFAEFSTKDFQKNCPNTKIKKSSSKHFKIFVIFYSLRLLNIFSSVLGQRKSRNNGNAAIITINPSDDGDNNSIPVFLQPRQSSSRNSWKRSAT